MSKDWGHIANMSIRYELRKLVRSHQWHFSSIISSLRNHWIKKFCFANRLILKSQFSSLWNFNLFTFCYILLFNNLMLVFLIHFVQKNYKYLRPFKNLMENYFFYFFAKLKGCYILPSSQWKENIRHKPWYI